MADTKLQSLGRGRVGAGILGLVAAGCTMFGMSADDQNAVMQMATMLFSVVSGGMALYSKYREGK